MPIRFSPSRCASDPVAARRPAGFILLLCLAALPAAQAQVISGRALVADGSRPVPGVVVQLVDSGGQVISRSLARDDGVFFLGATHAGTFTIRSLRLGFRPFTYGPFTADSTGRAGIQLLLRDVPVSLAAIHVTGSNECVGFAGDAGGAAVLDVWTEARTSLLASMVARDDQAFDVSTTRYERYASSTGQTLHLRLLQHRGKSGRPFVSPLPPEQYATAGYRDPDSTSMTYRAPDADVLLSDGFAARHCLRLARDGAPDEVGVSFEPLPSAPSRRADGAPLVDVAGTLWVDRTTAMLRRAEFHYTNVEREIERVGAGGTIGFTYLPGNVPVITSWSVTLPQFVRGPARLGGTVALVGRWTIGGELAEARRRDTLLWSAPNARLVGRVQGGDDRIPSPAARVSLAGTPYTALADDAGRWTMEHLLPGRYELLVQSAMSERLALDPRHDAVIDVTLGTPANVTLDAGSAEDAVRASCDGAPRGSGALLVQLDSTLLSPRPYVAALWSSADVPDGFVTQPDARGRVRLCGVPRDKPLDVVVAADNLLGARLARVPTRIPRDSVYVLVPVTRNVPAPAAPVARSP